MDAYEARYLLSTLLRDRDVWWRRAWAILCGKWGQYEQQSEAIGTAIMILQELDQTPE